MKKLNQIISTFLVITFMVLLYIPCSHASDDNSRQAETSFQPAQKYHQEQMDNCSPLCSCDCCSTEIVVDHFPVSTVVSPEIIPIFSLFKQPFISSFFSCIWQPPKIS